MSSPSNAPAIRIVRNAALLIAVALPLLGIANSIEPVPHYRQSIAGTRQSASNDSSTRHMLMSPSRRGTAADTARAMAIAATLRAAIAKYRDTSAAVADGYMMFAPEIKQQKVYHFSNRWAGVHEAFRFDPAKPTSLLYRRGADGRFILTGAMYIAPNRYGPDQLDQRIPLSVARWHKHVNWCIPPRSERARWLERRDGHPVFGPESPIATKAECDAVHGNFRETVFSWMVHANVFQGDDVGAVWGDEHSGHDMHEGMTMGDGDAR